MTALMHAADSGNISTFKALIKHKAKHSYKDKRKRSLINIAEDKNQQKIINHLIQTNAFHISKTKLKQLLLHAAANGKIKTIKIIANKGINLNTIDSSGNTPLILVLRYV